MSVILAVWCLVFVQTERTRSVRKKECHASGCEYESLLPERKRTDVGQKAKIILSRVACGWTVGGSDRWWRHCSVAKLRQESHLITMKKL